MLLLPEAVRVFRCLARFQSQQALLLTARTAVGKILLEVHYKRLDLWAAADRWNQSLAELDWVLTFLNQAEDDRRTAISELSVYTLTVGDRGGCLAQLRKFSIA